ncbi:unnamed protein product [Owenia fusiformis]|uniref:Uncharacterized protein n=1 Tax=Owenia fusiformis TaxID=6347 RepID=A0A8S4MZ46_OWEFU|nr:unnamed protein product [Owenia fusiformis]
MQENREYLYAVRRNSHPPACVQMALKHLDLDVWLATSVEWSQKQNISTLAEIVVMRDDLESTLISLKIELDNLGEIGIVFKKYPSIGHFLGRLCGVNGLLLSKGVYLALMKCVMWFYVENPKSPVEVKAKQWALSQLRSTVSYGKEQFPMTALKSTGTTQSTFNTVCLQQVIQDLTKDLHGPTREWDHNLQCHIPHQPKKVPSHTIRDIITILKAVSGGQGCDDLEETLLRYIAKSEQTVGVREVYKTLQQQSDLSYGAKLILWSNYLPHLERTLLELLRSHLNDEGSRIDKMCNIKQSMLDRACAERPYIYDTVFWILENLYEKSGWDPCISDFIGLLHSSIVELIYMSNAQLSTAPLKCCRSWLHSLVNLIQLSSKNLRLTCCEAHLTAIRLVLCDVIEGATTKVKAKELLMLLTQHKEWCHIALQCAFIASKKVSQDCTYILCVLHCLLGDASNVAKCQESINDIVLSLRGLMSKSSLTIQDVKLAIQPAINTALSQTPLSQTSVSSGLLHTTSPLVKNCTTAGVENEVVRITKQLVMVFIVMSQNGINLIEDIFKVLQIETPRTQLISLLETLEHLQTAPRLRRTNNKTKIQHHLQHLLNSIEMPDSWLRQKTINTMKYMQ